MKIKIYINGLLPLWRDKRNEEKPGGSLLYIKIEGDDLETIEKRIYSDNNGEVEFDIDESYIGADILVHIRHRWYKPLSIKTNIEEFGYFYTAKIEMDYTNWEDSPSTDPPWDSQGEFTAAQATKDRKLREFRFQNRNSKILYYLILGISVLLGIILPPFIGVPVAIIIIILLEVLSPYSIGLKRAIKKK